MDAKPHGSMTDVFISYALADSAKLRVPAIAGNLAKRPGIDMVHYWEGWKGYLNSSILCGQDWTRHG
jgi:hypothetical protein